MHLKLLLSFLLLCLFFNAFGQQETYFYKIQEITARVHIAPDLLNRLDSLKRTRRPSDSHIKTIFNRDLDFGYKHQRIEVVFNSDCRYQVNLLIKNDTICLSSTTFSNGIFSNEYEDDLNKKHSIPVIDSAKAINYLKLRNSFYISTYKLADLKERLDYNELFALNNGDGYNETWEKKHIDALVANKNIKALEQMLKDINCERQIYGVYGLGLLVKKGVKIPLFDQELIDYVKKRNSEIITCKGDLCGFVEKPYK